jgi:hypothetical protein
VKISGGRIGIKTSSYSMLKKALLMRSETNMLLMSPGDMGAPIPTPPTMSTSTHREGFH